MGLEGNMIKIMVSTTGHQRGPDGIVEKVDHQTEGQYYCRNGKHYIKYCDDSLTKDDSVRTTLKTDGGDFFVFRRGAVDTDMRFSLGKTTSTLYRTPYSMMEMKISTKQLSIDIGEATGQVDLCYDMAVNDTLVGEYELQIKIIPSACKQAAPPRGAKVTG